MSLHPRVDLTVEHASFGIAIDVSSVDEPQGQCSSTVNRYHRRIWEDHSWYWGLAFCDPMHFQYATNY